MQFQSDLLNPEVLRPSVTETTALGAAYMAGLAVGYWKDIEEIKKQWHVEKRFTPSADREKIDRELAGWHDAVRRVLTPDSLH